MDSFAGKLFHKMYPKCILPSDKSEIEYIKRIGDEVCDRFANNVDCKYDEGGKEQFIHFVSPLCHVN